MALKTAAFLIDGMTCQGCVAGVTRALKAVSGVADVTVSFDDKCATAHYDDAQTAPATLIAAIENAGFDAQMSATS
ncbi:MAG: heavy-metal-associated domain-containing protein [Proteobacteria bacterium]|nr:heavy-metal-associated domain-containing protein [Pseudomonadota bacterium]MCL2308143.1 heavy-metal-associated domain-containing protein [Pseudomonadota bacterium]